LISVIVPAYNAAGTLGECLAALLEQSIPRSEYEVIVVDDGSTDSTQEVVKRYGVRLLSQPNQGPGAARNLGVSQARGEIVLFTDADCVPVREWIEEMVKPLAEPDVVAVKGAYRTHQKALLARFIQAEFAERYALLERERYVDFVDSHSAAYRKAEFMAAGGFDPDFLLSEDVDLSYRLSRQGHKMIFNPKAIVYHCHPETLWAYFRAKFQRAYWRTKSYRQHPGKMLRDSYTPQTMKAQIGLAFLLGMALLSLLVSRTSALITSAVIIGFGFLLSTLPFSIRVAPKDPLLGFVSPLLLLYRAMALGLGFVAGFLTQWVGRLWHDPK
jgi:cellulose synthase/poly-beta-1,6-N-acetylglucosamine synthase-like glycosyltransferase